MMMSFRFVYHCLIISGLCFQVLSCQSGAGKESTASETNISVNNNSYSEKIRSKRKNKDQYMINKGIIGEEYRSSFKGLEYFDIDTSFRIKAKITKLPPIRYIFKTNTERSPEYFTYAILNFNIGDSLCKLIAYSTEENASSGLFIPFKDASSGKETYGGGRYLELPYNGETEWFELDFNLAFNPYCHYNADYSCPLVPIENILKVKIPAGEKKFHD